jgi:hypothetical protein
MDENLLGDREQYAKLRKGMESFCGNIEMVRR